MTAGGSARREFERRREARVERLRDNRGPLLAIAGVVTVVAAAVSQQLLGVWWPGAVVALLALANQILPSQREAAWRKGAEGEEAIGRVLDGLGPSTRVLHDRRIPGSQANIDHILVAPSGVWTIDAKNYSGELQTRRGDQELWIAGRNRSKLLEQATGQAAVVGRALRQAGLEAVPVHPALCFVGVEWPLVGRPRSAADVRLLSPRGLRELPGTQSTLSSAQIQSIAEHLERQLSPAGGTVRSRPDAPIAPSSPPPTAASSSGATPHAGLTVKPWNRYGKNRLYVNTAEGVTLGYVDLSTNEVVAVEHHRETVRRAVERYLRES